MKSMLGFLILCLVSTQAFAINKIDHFYKKQIDEAWTVYGNAYDENQRAACFAENRYKDGSIFQLSINPGTNDLYIWFKDNTWEMKSHSFHKDYPVRLNLFNDDKIIDGGNMTFTVLDKNTIQILHIGQKPFFKTLLNSNKIVFVMPGTVLNATVRMAHTPEVLKAFEGCIREYESEYNG